jgi:hypothetical protein
MMRKFGSADQHKRLLVPDAEPQDVWLSTTERQELERINERFLALLKQEQEKSKKTTLPNE